MIDDEYEVYDDESVEELMAKFSKNNQSHTSSTSNYTGGQIKYKNEALLDLIEKCQLCKNFNDGVHIDHDDLVRIQYNWHVANPDYMEKYFDILKDNQISYSTRNKADVIRKEYNSQKNKITKPMGCGQCKNIEACSYINECQYRKIGNVKNMLGVIDKSNKIKPKASNFTVNNAQPINPNTGKPYNFIREDNDGNLLITNVNAFQEWIDNYLKNYIIDNKLIMMLKPGGQRLWDEQRKYWVLYKNSDYQPDLFFKQLLAKLLGRGVSNVYVNMAKGVLRDIEYYGMANAVEKELTNIPITFNNGTLYIEHKNGKVFATFNVNEFKKENYCIFKLNVDFTEDMIDENYWKNSFLGKYLMHYYDDTDRPIIQRFLGSCYVPEYSIKTVLIIKGPTNSAKTTTQELYRKAFFDKDNVTGSLPVEDWDGSFLPSYILPNAIYNLSDEVNIDKKALAAAIKRMISEDSMHIWNVKNKTPFSSTPFFKCVITCNEYPNVVTDSATMTRFCLTEVSGKRDDSQTITANEWKTQFNSQIKEMVSFALCGLIKQVEEDFPNFETQKQYLKDEFMEQNSLVAEFYDKYLQPASNPDNYFMSTDNLFHTYVYYARDNYEKMNTFNKVNTFSTAFEQILIVKKIQYFKTDKKSGPKYDVITKTNKRGWFGLEWNEEGKKWFKANKDFIKNVDDNKGE